jgi:ubiquinone/menaquinone biosynthesis C-methylase UbiE
MSRFLGRAYLMPIVPSQNNDFMFDNDSGLETARLMELDSLLTQLLGGLLPAPIDLSSVQTVLDLACGPGGWPLDMAFAHPRKKVTGVDISRAMIRYAEAQAAVRQLQNVHFSLSDVLQPFSFSENSFDLINARLLRTFVPKHSWLPLLTECLRILSPGGTAVVTEAELFFSNSPSFERFNDFLAQALWRAGFSFSPDGRNLGITPMLRTLLRKAGFTKIQHNAQAIDFSVGTQHYISLCQNLLMQNRLFCPFLITMGVATREELDRLLQDMQIACYDADFCGIWYFLSAWGQKSL